MSKKYVIGIDIGGTNTDIVLVDENQRIIKAFKTATVTPLEFGVKTCLEYILRDKTIEASSIKSIFIGTTHATNAIVEQKNLYKVGLIRIAGHNPTSLRPCFEWPKDLLSKVFVGFETIDGGFECDLREISPFSKKKAKEAFLKLLEKGMESLAIIGVFSPLSTQHEIECLEAIREITGEDFPVSLSSEIGGIGFIERENATILNAALKKPMKEGFNNLESVKNSFGFTCPLYITQNDGSLIDLNETIKNPILTLSSGPTNSFLGASRLRNLKDAIIVDVGGTTTDIGVIQNGVLRRSLNNVNIGGIALNFRMPDVMSIGIGGGSYVEKMPCGDFKVGPESSGKKLLSEALSFGGQKLTLTDVAAVTKLFNFGNQYQVSFLEKDAQRILAKIFEKIQNVVALMKGEKKDLPILYVGGGAILASQNSSDVLEHASVANAYGASLAEFSGTIDKVVSLQDRSKVMDELKNEALELSIKKGASRQNAKVVDVVVIPYHYVPNQLARVIVTASGRS